MAKNLKVNPGLELRDFFARVSDEVGEATNGRERLTPFLSLKEQKFIVRGSSNERRIALVIGNSAYSHREPLATLRDDAETVAAAFLAAGFQTVELEYDTSREKLIEILKNFASISRDADWAAVYYFGHAVHVRDTNYLVPVNANLLTIDNLERDLVPLNTALEALGGVRKLRLVLTDSRREPLTLDSSK